MLSQVTPIYYPVKNMRYSGQTYLFYTELGVNISLLADIYGSVNSKPTHPPGIISRKGWPWALTCDNLVKGRELYNHLVLFQNTVKSFFKTNIKSINPMNVMYIISYSFSES